MNKIQQSAVSTLTIESDAISNLIKTLDENFTEAVNYIFTSNGRLIITGMGKSGVIGLKLAATFSSTGTPAFFLHPAEGVHGDLGMIQPDDVVLALSYSGETDELLKIVPYLKDYSAGVIAMTGNDQSTLAKTAKMHINIHVEKEACAINLAPTASTTATLAMGDALAVAVMELRDFQPEQFAKYHPGGSLGRKLLTTVSDVMRSSKLPIVDEKSPTKEVVHQISEGRLGLVIVLQNNTKNVGIITDGDIRRAMETNEPHFFSLKAMDIMTPSAKTISPKAKLHEAEELMTRHKIAALIVQEKDEVKGVLQIYDVQ